MKKYWRMFIFGWCIGLTALILQSIVDPLVLNNITGILEHFHPSSGRTLVILLIVFLVSSILAIAARAGSLILRKNISANIRTDRSLQLMQKILFTENTFLQKNDPEKMVARIARDTETFSEYQVSSVLEIPLASLGLLVTLYMMFCGSLPWLERLGLSAQRGDVLLGLIIVCMSPLHVSFLIYHKKIMQIEQKQADAYEKEFQTASESLRGITDVRASRAFSFILRRMFSVFTESKTHRIRLFSIFAFFQHIGGFVWSMTQVVVLAVSAWLISRPGSDFGFRDYIGFSILCGMFNQYVTRGVQVVLDWQRAKPAQRRLRELDALPDRFGDNAGTALRSGSRCYRLEKVNFRIDDKIKILDDVDLQIGQGEHVALVGPSGCGKSTLLRMIMRHLSPSAGSICFSGQNIEEIRFSDYSRLVTWVSQKPFLFTGSIYDNIFVGRDLPLTDAGLLEILEDVVLTADLMRKALDMPARSVCPECADDGMLLREFLATDAEKGALSEAELFQRLEKSGRKSRAVLAALQFRIQADGQGVSGGQTAKIALARALAGAPEVLLLDEVTAPLDELSQERIMKVLAEKYGNRTILFVSHRIPAVRGMERILVMDAGRIVQDGTYDGLSRQPGLFAELVAKESGAE